MKWTHCVLAALFAAGMSSAGCDKSSENTTKYGAGAPVGFASAGAGTGAGGGGAPAVGSGGETGAAGMGTAGMVAAGTGGAGVVTGSGGAGPVTGSGGMDGGGASAPAGSGGMSGGSGGMAAGSNEPCPDINIVDFMIMLPGCCDMASNQCGIDGAMFGGTGCTPLAEAQMMAMSMGAPPGTIPDPRPCPAM